MIIRLAKTIKKMRIQWINQYHNMNSQCKWLDNIYKNDNIGSVFINSFKSYIFKETHLQSQIIWVSKRSSLNS